MPPLTCINLYYIRQALLKKFRCCARAQVEALMVGLVYGVFASRAVILHSILREKMTGDKEMQHRTWVLAVTLATWQWAPSSAGSTGKASGAHDHQVLGMCPLSE